jgi:phosphatidate cytidylyltransferase
MRILSGIVLAPLTLAIIYYGGWLFLLLMIVSFFIALQEWYGMSKAGKSFLKDIITGSIYLSICYISYIYLRFFHPEGAFLAMVVMLCVWSSDIGAYFTGKKFGGPKLAPVISPNKTWSGFGGAVLFSGIMMLLLLFIYYENPLAGFVVGCILGAVGQAGDLFISSFKRRVKVKDTGSLIPGHGGLLDRIDALLLCSPIFLLLILVI